MERVMSMVPSKFLLRTANHPSELFFAFNIIHWVLYLEGLENEMVVLDKLTSSPQSHSNQRIPPYSRAHQSLYEISIPPESFNQVLLEGLWCRFPGFWHQLLIKCTRRDEGPRQFAMTVAASENLVDKSFSNSRKAACYQPSKLWYSKLEDASVQKRE